MSTHQTTMNAEKAASWQAMKERIAKGEIKLPELREPVNPCTDHMVLAVGYAAEGIVRK